MKIRSASENCWINWVFPVKQLLYPYRKLLLRAITSINCQSRSMQTQTTDRRKTPFEECVAGRADCALSVLSDRVEKLVDRPNMLADLCSLSAHFDRIDILEQSASNLVRIPEFRLFAIGQKIRIATDGGMPLEQALASVSHNLAPTEQAMINASLRKHPLGRKKSNQTHIAICGVSFCGSTLLDRILGSLRGIASIGESHWLTKSYDGQNQGALDILSVSRGSAPLCSRCGEACSVLTPEFRTSLLLDPTDWYNKIGSQLGANTLVSADKNMPKLIRNDPLLRLNALVVFKSPLQAWLSKYNKIKSDIESSELEGSFHNYMDVWVKAYRQFLGEFRPNGGKVFLNFDLFCKRPAEQFSKLAQTLRLQDDLNVLRHISIGHAIGGNSRTIRALRVSAFEIEILPRSDDELPSSHIDWLEERVDATELYAELCRNAL